jgi:MFS family permease
MTDRRPHPGVRAAARIAVRPGSPCSTLCASLGRAIVVRKAEQNPKRRRLARQLRLFPRQFWLLVGGTFFYLVAIGTAFPYTAILIKGRLGVSMAVVGAIIGGTALAGLPLQPLAGSLSDRFGRRAVMIVCAAFSGIMYGSLAFVHGVVPVCLAVFCDRALGWPLFLTASNAMVADLVRARLRPEGYSLVRLMIGAGEIVGPLIAAALLAAGFGLPILFVLAGAGCFAFLVFTLVALRETRPRVARRVRSTTISEGPPVYGVRDVILIPSRRRSRRRRKAAAGPQGYRRVLGDRRFCAFCAISLLPLFIFGQTYSTFPVLLTSYLKVPRADYGLLMSYMALVIVITQYPSVRAIKRLDPMYQVAVASVLFGCGIGLSAFMPAAWPLLVTIGALGLAQAIFGPVTSTIVAHLAPVELRGRYMGAWTFVWMAGQGSLGPIFGGLLLARFGVHVTYLVIIAFGLAGAGLYPLLRTSAGTARRRVVAAP